VLRHAEPTGRLRYFCKGCGKEYSSYQAGLRNDACETPVIVPVREGK
jgi:hypothetical protein